MLGGAGPTSFRFDVYTTQPPGTTLNPAAVGFTGNGLPHDNMQPTLVLNWCIAWQGILPSRN